MSTVAKGMERARMNDKRHDGKAARVREVLAASAGPLTPYAIGLASGLRIESVRRTLATLVCTTGGVVSVHTRRGIAYQLFSQAAKPPKSRAGLGRAAPITIGRGFRWWSEYA